ncbi:hypothetical protein PAPYR_5234 [Paratrimastix pyriformis]|uniref:Uncharacterized protein n=1 Tax=Paratrimastix pyriformis TaxID=342808 RepID=A0ABQ8UI96_9EUKA|nr:hypothetical protein PAPYR_5234 [Paratrimastix pyriformis]
MEAVFDLIPADLWLHVADADASVQLHCLLSGTNHRLRGLMKFAKRLCWPAGAYRVGNSIISVRPPLPTIFQGCAESLQFLSIEFDEGPGGWEWDPCLPAQFAEVQYTFPQLHTLSVRNGSSICLIERCPRLEVLHLLNCHETLDRDFPRFLAGHCPNLRSLRTVLPFMSECLTEFCGLKSPRPRQHLTLLREIGASLGDDEESDLPLPASSSSTPLSADNVRTLSMDCHPIDLPPLLAYWPHLAKLTVALQADELVGHASLLRSLAAPLEQCTHLRQLDLHLPSAGTARALTLTPDELAALRLGLVLTGLSACLAFPDPEPVFPARLSRCSLTLKNLPPALTIDLPLVEDLSLYYLATTPIQLRLRCPRLRSFRTATDGSPRAEAVTTPVEVAVEGLMPRLSQIAVDTTRLSSCSVVFLHQNPTRSLLSPSSGARPISPPVPATSWDEILRYFLPLVVASREPLDLSLVLPRRPPALDDLPIADSWRVRSLTLTGPIDPSIGSSLRLPASVARLTLKTLRAVNVVGPGVRLLEWQSRRADSRICLETPQLETLLITADRQPQVIFTTPPPPVRTLALWLDEPELRALATLAHTLRGTLEVLVARTAATSGLGSPADHRPVLPLDGPALRRVFCDTAVRFLADCPCARRGPAPLAGPKERNPAPPRPSEFRWDADPDYGDSLWTLLSGGSTCP